jgi:phosphotransferase system enzyme I (PtsI)
MARARGIPAVVGARRLAALARDGDTVAVDGFAGRVILNPGPGEIERFRKRRRAFVRLQRRRERLAAADPVTRDGHRVVLGANMEIPEEIDYIESRGADGVGLFRTEFFFMLHQRVPTEEEQVAVYGEIARRLAGRELVVRVLDVGGDKVASYLHLARERNPYLGMRGIRYLLSHRDVFRTQLRALLRAGTEGPISILLPMVHAVDELEATRALLAEAAAELAREGVSHDPSPRVGVMIEVPSAVLLAEEFARRCDFLSLGSNDLMQYLLAVDRDHEALRDLYDPLHPAVLRAVERVVRAGHREGKPVSLCGEMGSDPRALPLLLGMGLDRLSVSPYLLPEVKQTIRVLRYADCRELAQDALTLPTAEAVHRCVEQRLGTDYSGVLRLAHEDNGRRKGARR